MRNAKELALKEIIRSLGDLEISVSKELKDLIEDLVNRQWEARNKDSDSAKDEAELLKLIRDYISRNQTQGAAN